MNYGLKSLNRLKSIDSIPNVISTLTNLDRELSKNKLAKLKVFNHTYLIISRNVYQKIQAGEFKDGNKMLKLDLNFAEFYFKAISDYQNGRPIDEAWKIAFNFCQDRKSYRLIYLILGANAHINNDLPLSLEKTIKDQEFYFDYKKVQSVIDLSINEVIDSINKMFPSRSYIDKNMLWIYKLIIKFLLRRWRRNAWSNYLKLKVKSTTQKEIKIDATQIAKNFTMIANLIPFS